MDLGTIPFPSESGRIEGSAQAMVILAVAAARQGSSPTALIQARLPVVQPRAGAAFAWPVADAIARWGGRAGGQGSVGQ